MDKHWTGNVLKSTAWFFINKQWNGRFLKNIVWILVYTWLSGHMPEKRYVHLH
jgi:hypothetical protein